MCPYINLKLIVTQVLGSKVDLDLLIDKIFVIELSSQSFRGVRTSWHPLCEIGLSYMFAVWLTMLVMSTFANSGCANGPNEFKGWG